MIKNVLKNKVLTTFFLVDLFSSIAVGSISTGASWYVLSETNLNSMLSIYMSLNVIASFCLSSYIGKLVDRRSRKKLISFSLMSRAILFFCTALLLLTLGFNFYVMCFVSIIFGIGWLLYYSSSRSYLQNTIPKENLGELNSVLEISLQVGMFISAGVTGILIEHIDFFYVLGYGAFFLLLSAILSMRLTKDVEVINKDQSSNEKFRENTIGVLSLFKYNKKIFFISLLSMIPLFIIQVYNVSMPGYILHTLKATSSVYGVADMLYGVGGMIAGLISGYLVSKIKVENLLLIVFCGLTIFFFVLYVQSQVNILLVISFLIGLFNSSSRIFVNTVLMEKVENEIMGRVTTFIQAVTQVSSLVLTLGVGLFNDRYGARISFIFVTILMLVTLFTVFKGRLTLQDEQFNTKEQ